MKNKFKALLSMLAVFSVLSVSAACSLLPGSSDSSDSLANSSVEAPADSSTSEKANYTVTFVDYDGTVLSSETYEEGATVTAPAAPTRDGNHIHTYKFVGWDQELSAVTGDVTYTAVYEIGFVEYVVTFLDDEGNEISKTTYHYGDTVKVPSGEKEADEYVYTFTGWDTEVDKTVSGDATYKATYTKELASYTITFMVDGEVVGTDTYSAEDKDITVPEIPAKDHYTAAWEAYELTAGDITVNAIYTPITYTITFMAGEEVVGTVDFNIEDSDKTAPVAPELTGYTAVWGEYSFSTLEDQTVSVTYTPNTYKITFDANGGKCDVEEKEVTYGAEFTLPTVAATKLNQEFVGWVDEFDVPVEEGTWEIAADATFKAVYTDYLTFDNATAAPSYLSGSRVQSISLVEMNGGKAIEFKSTTDSTSDIGVHITLDFLNDFFADSSVDYLAFDLKLAADATTTNEIYFNDFRSGASSWTRYESTNCDVAYNYAPTASFKSFYLPRSAYEAWVTNNVTAPRFLMVGKGVFGGQSFYVDNIRPVTEAQKVQDWWSFEYGGLRTNNGDSPLFYTPDNSQWELNFSNVDPTTIKFTNEIYSDGNRALTFTKRANKVTIISLNHTTETAGEKELREAGYMSYDLYVPEGSDAALIDNTSGVYESLSIGWNTIYAKVPAIGDERENNLTQFWDSTGSTYVIDNIRVLTKEEFDYYGDMFGFEGNIGVIRDETAAAEKTLAYLYMPRDHFDARWTMVVSATEATTKITNFHYDTKIVHDGNSSLAFHKTNGYVYLSFNTGGEMYKQLKDGFTFWIYVDLDEQPAINVSTKNFINGCNENFSDLTDNIVKGTWRQITVTAEDINSSGRFLIIQGSTAGTYYIDGIQPLSADAE